MTRLTPDLAGRLARIALGHIGREYPNILVQVLGSADDLAPPSALHPIFYGSYDWHSCVHGHWLLARLLRRQPGLAEATAIRAHFDRVFTPDRVDGERRYLARPGSDSFERPYGWAWLLKLAAELRQLDGPGGGVWSFTLQPLAQDFAGRFEQFLPRADYPVRAGVHANSAFALALAHDYGRETGDPGLVGRIEAKALDWYGADTDCQAWEPSGDDFLSPALVEAELMGRVLPTEDFRAWFERFLPRAGAGEPATLFMPARVSDRGDGKIAHLDGLNLSRAWCWRGIAAAHGPGDPVTALALQAAERHLAASLNYVEGDYMGEHWLASFALLALEDD